MLKIIAVFLGIVAGILVIAVLLVRFTVYMTTLPDISSADPAELPPGVLEFFDRVQNELGQIGFSTVQDAVLKGYVPNVTTYFRLFDNRKAGDAAMAAFMLSYSGDKVLQQNQYVEFSTEFSTGEEICTNNSNTPSSFKEVPEKRIIQFPKIIDLDKLYELHQEESLRFGKAAQKILPPEGYEIIELQKSMIKDMERQVRVGYFYLEQTGEVYRPTWQGAFFMLLKTIFCKPR